MLLIHETMSGEDVFIRIVSSANVSPSPANGEHGILILAVCLRN